MRRKICGLLIVIGVALLFCIVGGIEEFGMPLSNAWWFVPIVLVILVATKIGRFNDEE